MTSKELRQIYYLNREKRLYEKELRKLRNRSIIKGQQLSGMPRGSSSGDPTSRNAVELAEYEKLIEEIEYKITVQINKIMQYINSIDDSYLRQVIFLRDISLLPWETVAAEMGGDNTADGMRMFYKRFLEKLDNEK